jgi:hypothetical protein
MKNIIRRSYSELTFWACRVVLVQQGMFLMNANPWVMVHPNKSSKMTHHFLTHRQRIAKLQASIEIYETELDFAEEDGKDVELIRSKIGILEVRIAETQLRRYQAQLNDAVAAQEQEGNAREDAEIAKLKEKASQARLEVELRTCEAQLRTCEAQLNDAISQGILGVDFIVLISGARTTLNILLQKQKKKLSIPNRTQKKKNKKRI